MKQIEKEYQNSLQFTEQEVRAFLKQHGESSAKSSLSMLGEMEDRINHFSRPKDIEVDFIIAYCNSAEWRDAPFPELTEEELETVSKILQYQDYETDNQELIYFSALWKLANIDYYEAEKLAQELIQKIVLSHALVTTFCLMSTPFFSSSYSLAGSASILTLCGMVVRVLNQQELSIEEKCELVKWLTKFYMGFGIAWGSIGEQISPVCFLMIPIAMCLSHHTEKEKNKRLARW